MNRYEQLQDFERLRQRIVELRDAGRSAAEIAAGLNQEGFRPPRGTAAYTGYTVSRFLVKYGLSAIMGGQINQALVRAHEWRVPQLAQELKVSPWSVRRWCRRGWVQARPLPGAPNRWIVWADRQELKRLRRLRDYAARWIVGDPYPEELITPTKRRKRDV